VRDDWGLELAKQGDALERRAAEFLDDLGVDPIGQGDAVDGDDHVSHAEFQLLGIRALQHL